MIRQTPPLPSAVTSFGQESSVVSGLLTWLLFPARATHLKGGRGSLVVTNLLRAAWQFLARATCWGGGCRLLSVTSLLQRASWVWLQLNQWCGGNSVRSLWRGWQQLSHRMPSMQLSLPWIKVGGRGSCLGGGLGYWLVCVGGVSWGWGSRWSRGCGCSPPPLSPLFNCFLGLAVLWGSGSFFSPGASMLGGRILGSAAGVFLGHFCWGLVVVGLWGRGIFSIPLQGFVLCQGPLGCQPSTSWTGCC